MNTEILQTESPVGDSPSDDVACADCGEYRQLVGPLTHGGEIVEGGDFVCRPCAESRGVGTPSGELRDTYHAALQHGHVTPAEDDMVLGVVRKPMYGIQSYLTENCPALAPPEALLSEFKERADELGHNPAVDAVDFRSRYRDHLTGDRQLSAMADIIERLQAAQTVWLVCYENTEDKWCHRDILADELRIRAWTEDLPERDN